MKKLTLVNILLLIGAITINAQQTGFPRLTGPYLGQKPPGAIPEVFAPGIVSKEGVQSKLQITPDGSEIIFNNMTVPGSSPSDRKISFISIEVKSGIWSIPTDIPFSTQYVNDEPALSSDGKKLFFVSDRPKSGTIERQKMPDIWMVDRAGENWGDPINIGLPVNTDGIEVQPFYSVDEKLYFGRDDGIYFSQFTNNQFLTPVKLDESIFRGRVRGICIAPDNATLIVHSDKPGGFGSWDLYVSFRNKSGSWTELQNLGNVINTNQPETNATFSPDGKYLFFSRRDDIYWVSAKIVEELRPKE